MRIIYINQHFKHPSVGRGSRGYEMARRIADRGHEVHIIASTADIKTLKHEAIENLNFHWLPIPYSQLMSYGERIKYFLTFAVRASSIARKLRGDVVFASSTPLTVAIPGIAATIFRRRPLVFEVRDLWPDAPIVMGALKSRFAQKLAFALEKFTYQYASHIVALSPDMKRGIMAKGIGANKVTVIPNASDNEMFENHELTGQQLRHKYEWLGGRKLVLYCGTLGRVNEVSYMAHLAAATFKINPSIRFLIVGAGSEEERVRATAKKLGVFGKNFYMLDRVPKSEVPGFFAAADISMSTVAPKPLLAANSANKVFDTFASGTPLGINHGGWLASLISETESGIVLHPTDLDQASKHLTEFLQSPEALQKASKNAKRLALECFDRQKLADRLAAILEQVDISRADCKQAHGTPANNSTRC